MLKLRLIFILLELDFYFILSGTRQSSRHAADLGAGRRAGGDLVSCLVFYMAGTPRIWVQGEGLGETW